MNTVIEKVEKAIASPTSPAERNVFLAAFATPTLAQLELRAPGGAFVRIGGNYPTTEFQPNAVIAMRYESPAQLYAMAALFATLARSMEDMQGTPPIARLIRPGVYAPEELKRLIDGGAAPETTVSGAGAAVPVSAGEPAR